ncbi:chromate transporter [Solirubrobacter sp. CPCC 204708]|uniref:Chromate transporter n=1 Tax=Solirubrobacter deserti TaxID=2282478 RepID=A0ABT4RBW6_9ACTN|nr:chromate transporter [Solirubrobacter deserti]MDA0136006.1 chromate transporter [Solirubrobacter deserti]
MAPVPLSTVLREWGRIGALGFGGPPAHVALLRDLTVDKRGWIDAREFEDAFAACNLLPGPASTQMSIFCAHRVAGRAGAIVGGLAFIIPGLILCLVIAAVALQDEPPAAVDAFGMGAAAAVVAVVVQAGLKLIDPRRGLVYVIAGALGAALTGPYVVVILLAAGFFELARHKLFSAVWPALVWLAVKVGALSYGGGYVIIPLMYGDAVEAQRWMSEQAFANAVAYGQITPGPVVHTVSFVGYAAAGLPGALAATAIAFTPSFVFILVGARHFQRLRTSPNVRAFLDGAGPAAAGAILGAAVPLLTAIDATWQWFVLAGAAIALLARVPPIAVLVGGAIAGLATTLF